MNIIYYLTWSKGLCRSDYAKDFEIERLSEWTQCIHKRSYERGRKARGKEEMKTDVQVAVVHVEDAGRGHEPRNAGSL